MYRERDIGLAGDLSRHDVARGEGLIKTIYIYIYIYR